MFTWICPVCGSEVPPSNSECPKCAEKVAQQRAAQAQQYSQPQYAPPQYAPPQPPPGQPPAAAQWQAPPQPPPPQAAAPQQAQWQAPPPQPPPPPQYNSQEGWQHAPIQQQTYVLGAEEPGKKGMSPWLVTLLVIAVVGGGLFGVYHYMSGDSGSKPAAEKAPVAKSRNPIMRDLELTGFRLIEDKGNKVRLKFVVVNHSGADLSGVDLKLWLTTTAAKEGEAPLATAEVKISDLGPWEIKDIEVPVKTTLRAYELPDWQFLKVGFDVLSGSE